MRWDYICPGCGDREERQVLAKDRDSQFCGRCKKPLARRQAFSSQLTHIPTWWNSDQLGLPQNAREEKVFRTSGWRPRGEAWWRNRLLPKEQRGEERHEDRRPAAGPEVEACWKLARAKLAREGRLEKRAPKRH